MKKNSVLASLLELVFVVMFAVAFFINDGGDSGVSGWTVFGFIMLAYLMLLLTRYMIEPGKSAVLGLSVYLVSAVYFFLQFAAGLYFLFTDTSSYKLELTVQIVLFGIYLIILIANLMANRNTSAAIDIHKKENSYIKGMSARAAALLNKAADSKSNKSLQRVYDLIHSSPSKSDPGVKGLEKEIDDKLRWLEMAVMKEDTEKICGIANELEKAIEERNRILKSIIQ